MVIVAPIIFTYIMRNGNAYYCGKTNNIDRRMKEHKKDRYKLYDLIWSVKGDHETKIKSFGIKRFYKLIKGGYYHGS